MFEIVFSIDKLKKDGAEGMAKSRSSSSDGEKLATPRSLALTKVQGGPGKSPVSMEQGYSPGGRSTSLGDDGATYSGGKGGGGNQQETSRLSPLLDKGLISEMRMQRVSEEDGETDETNNTHNLDIITSGM